MIHKSIRLAFLLRHDRDYEFPINGWREVKNLIDCEGYTMDELVEIVKTNNKQRYEFSADMTKIRARQGHSVNVDVGLEECVPPPILYHGTAEHSLEAVMREGLKRQTRLHVHLSADVDTAANVGRRHGKPVVVCIDAARMAEDGGKFYLSRNGVWLADEVKPQYLYLLPD